MARKTVREKMARPAEIVAEGKLLIPAPNDVEALVRKIPRGRVMTQGEVREELARAAGVEAACPLTTGIFLRLVAEASEEDSAAGKLWDKSPGGVEEQARRLRGEGVEVQVKRGVLGVAV